MSAAWCGGCACGQIRYDIPSQPVSMSHCQCRDCQRMSGTGHGSYLTFLGRGEITLLGQATLWDHPGDSGRVKTRAFCAECGSPVYMTFGFAPDVFVIHAASLDDPGRFAPQKVMYAASGHDWDILDDTLPRFPRMPPR